MAYNIKFGWLIESIINDVSQPIKDAHRIGNSLITLDLAVIAGSHTHHVRVYGLRYRYLLHVSSPLHSILLDATSRVAVFIPDPYFGAQAGD